MLVFVYCALAFRPDGGPGRHPRQHAARRRPRKDGERLPPGRRSQNPPPDQIPRYIVRSENMLEISV